ncbi:class I SAM-dependent methyltransferase [Pseudodesulfovibrio indicus]|uniref:class I SAM-dependent DNA methyltransferase n=1 Tax=Pseudodesulfovibrio indicus TaxID=1716143 RepID=UPI00292FF405|nr:class I SAM-dependent methyltransferase [Pseudodesulfovibrio indicus]
MEQTPEKWVATYEAKTPDELAEAYRCWAREYDRDTCEGMGYVGPGVAARLLDRYLDSAEAKILDAGCGTGLVGQAMHHMGYRRIEAMDYCRDMLDVAEEKRVYENVFRADMNRELTISDNAYDATICVGTFTYAHVGPDAFDELVRITRPGGYVCFTVRDGAYQEYGYRKRMLELEASNAFELKEMVDTDYLDKEDVTAKYCIYEVQEA